MACFRWQAPRLVLGAVGASRLGLRAMPIGLWDGCGARELRNPEEGGSSIDMARPVVGKHRSPYPQDIVRQARAVTAKHLDIAVWPNMNAGRLVIGYAPNRVTMPGALGARGRWAGISSDAPLNPWEAKFAIGARLPPASRRKPARALYSSPRRAAKSSCFDKPGVWFCQPAT